MFVRARPGSCTGAGSVNLKLSCAPLPMPPPARADWRSPSVAQPDERRARHSGDPRTLFPDALLSLALPRVALLRVAEILGRHAPRRRLGQYGLRRVDLGDADCAVGEADTA
jgi:hypothetical protein